MELFKHMNTIIAIIPPTRLVVNRVAKKGGANLPRERGSHGRKIEEARRCHGELLGIAEALCDAVRPLRDYPDGGLQTELAGKAVDEAGEALGHLTRARMALERLISGGEREHDGTKPTAIS